MATEYDWSEINGVTVDRLRAPKTVPVPEPIVKQAQRSVDGDPKELKNTLALEHRFETEEKAVQFAKFMKKAGALTKPVATMLVVVDPLHEGDPLRIRWQASKRRGRATA
jgi:hypothetical protein